MARTWRRQNVHLIYLAHTLSLFLWRSANAGGVRSNGITSIVTITPNVTKPYEWVTLRCQFNLNADETTVLYWGDDNGDTIYIYEKNKPVRKGPKYSNGEIQNIQTKSGDHSLELYVDGCNKSPYKCDIWRDTDEKIKQASLEIKNIQTPSLLLDNVKTISLNIEKNKTYSLKCVCNDATAKHNLTMEIQGLNSQTAPDQVDSTYEPENCLFSSKVEKDFDLMTTDLFSIKCVAQYDKGERKVTTVMIPTSTTALPDIRSGTSPDIWFVATISGIIVLITAPIIFCIIVTVIIKRCWKNLPPRPSQELPVAVGKPEHSDDGNAYDEIDEAI